MTHDDAKEVSGAGVQRVSDERPREPRSPYPHESIDLDRVTTRLTLHGSFESLAAAEAIRSLRRALSDAEQRAPFTEEELAVKLNDVTEAWRENRYHPVALPSRPWNQRSENDKEFFRLIASECNRILASRLSDAERDRDAAHTATLDRCLKALEEHKAFYLGLMEDVEGEDAEYYDGLASAVHTAITAVRAEFGGRAGASQQGASEPPEGGAAYIAHVVGCARALVAGMPYTMGEPGNGEHNRLRDAVAELEAWEQGASEPPTP